MDEEKTPAQIAEEAAQGGGYIKASELVGTVFYVDGFEEKTTKFGDRYVGLIRRDANSDDVERGWLSGVVVQRQLDALAEAGAFPVLVKLTRPDDKFYKLEVVDPDSFDAEMFRNGVTGDE